MRKYLYSLFVVFMFFCHKHVLSQPSESVLLGRVILSSTLENLVGAKVVLTNTRYGAITDKTGRFRIENIPAGNYIIQTSLKGFQSSSIPVSIDSSTIIDTLVIELKEKLPEAMELEVSAERELERNSTYTLTPKELFSTAGAFEDVLRALYTLPGVLAPSDFNPQLTVRGGGADQNLFLLENVEVFNPYRLFGGVSTFNPMMLSTLNLYIGGFSARYGDRLSAVLDVKVREGSRNRPFSVSGNVSLIDANLVAEGNLSGLNGSWLISFRRTYLDLIIASLIGEESLPSFLDGQIKLTTRPMQNHQFEFFGTIGSDGFARAIPPDANQISSQGNLGTNDNIIALTYRYSPSATFNSMTVLSRYQTFTSGSFNSQIRQLSTTRDYLNYNQQSTLQKWSVLQRFYVVASPHSFEGGFGMDWLDTKFSYARRDFFPVDSAIAAQTQTQFGSARPASLDASIMQYRLNWFIQSQFNIENSFFLEPSIRFDYYQLLQKFYFSPRLNVRAELSDAVALTGAFGLFRQSPGIEKWIDQNPALLRLDFDDPTNILDLSNSSIVSNLNPESAFHYILGLSTSFDVEWQVKLEGYYKNLYDVITQRKVQQLVPLAVLRPNTNPVLSSSYDIILQQQDVLIADPANSATGEVYGIEVTLEKKRILPTDIISGWISYAYSRSSRSRGGISVPFSYDRPHSANIVLNFRPSREWEFGLTWRFMSGAPYTPVLNAVPLIAKVSDNSFRIPSNQNGQAFFIPNFGAEDNQNSARLPDYHRLDIRVTYTRKWGEVNWQFYIDISNLYNRQNIVGFNQFVNNNRQVVLTPQRMLPLIPTLGFNIAF
jgi:hypothetical protein